MTNFSKLSTLLFLALFVTACAPVTNQKPIFDPSQTPPIVSTATAVATTTNIKATSTDVSLATSIPTKAPSAFPLAAIEILSPATGFPLTSPFEIVARLPQDYSGIVQIELLGKDGRLLFKEIIGLDQASSREEVFQSDLIFDIASEQENGRLSLSITDNYGRLLALSSVELVLQSSGEREAFIASEIPEKIWIQQPMENSVQESGALQISGIGFPQSQRPFEIKIRNRLGKVLAFGEAYLEFSPDNDYGTFEIILDVKVTEAQWLQIGVRELGSSIPGVVHFSSLEFQLLPPSDSED